jgi:hypothetical protein
MRAHQLSFLFIGVLAPMLLAAAPQGGMVAAQYHFLGGNQLVANPNAALLKQIGEKPATTDFRHHLVRKTALDLAASFGKQLNPSSTNAAALMVPLVDDLISSESVGLFGGKTQGPMAFVLAVQLNPGQTKVWQDNLGKILATAPEKIVVEGFQGQNWKNAAFQVIPAKGWLIVSRGNDLAAQQTELLTSLNKIGRPTSALKTNWFEGDANWTRLAAWLPLQSSPFKLARTQITLSSKADQIVTSLKIQYPETIPWKRQPWNVPTNLVRDPVISFTAARNIAPFMAPAPSFAKLKVNPWNEQFYVWSMWTGMPFQTFGAIPANDPTNTFLTLAAQLPSVFNSTLATLNGSSFIVTSNHQSVVMDNIPQIVPRIRPVTEPNGGFLAMDFMGAVSTRSTKPAPPELFAQLNSQKDIIYYDWEITEKRLECWRSMFQFLQIIKRIPTPIPGIESLPPAAASTSTNRAALIPRLAKETWLTAVAPLLGNTITVATLSGPNEVTVTRKSQLGVTGFELLCLSDWLTGASYMPANRSRASGVTPGPSVPPPAFPMSPGALPPPSPKAKPTAPASAPNK